MLVSSKGASLSASFPFVLASGAILTHQEMGQFAVALALSCLVSAVVLALDVIEQRKKGVRQAAFDAQANQLRALRAELAERDERFLSVLRDGLAALDRRLEAIQEMEQAFGTTMENAHGKHEAAINAQSETVGAALNALREDLQGAVTRLDEHDTVRVDRVVAAISVQANQAAAARATALEQNRELIAAWREEASHSHQAALVNLNQALDQSLRRQEEAITQQLDAARSLIEAQHETAKRSQATMAAVLQEQKEAVQNGYLSFNAIMNKLPKELEKTLTSAREQLGNEVNRYQTLVLEQRDKVNDANEDLKKLWNRVLKQLS